MKKKIKEKKQKQFTMDDITDLLNYIGKYKKKEIGFTRCSFAADSQIVSVDIFIPLS